jgi:hypothetical protein
VAEPPPPGPAPAAALPIDDPHGFGLAVARLSGGDRRSARVVLGIAAASLDDDELVESIVVGKLADIDAAAVLTDTRLLLLDDRQWRPGRTEVAVDAGTSVQGLVEGNHATLVFTRGDVAVTLTRIGDLALAQEFAARVRARAAGD